MKNWFLLCLTLIQGGKLIALPIGNPTESGLLTNGACIYSYGCYDICDPCFSFWEAWSARIGFYGDYIFNRHLKVHQDRGHSPTIQRTELFTNAAYWALDFCNKVDLFGTLGVTELNFQGNTSAFPHVLLPDQSFEMHFRPQFSWSVGGRGIVYELSSLGLGIECQYFRATPQVESIHLRAENETLYPDSFYTLYTEWQIGIGGAFRFEVNCPDVALIPYMGVCWSSAKLHMNHKSIALEAPGSSITFIDLKSEKPWVYAIGTSLSLFEIVGITVEGRFAGEKAFYVNGQVRF